MHPRLVQGTGDSPTLQRVPAARLLPPSTVVLTLCLCHRATVLHMVPCPGQEEIGSSGLILKTAVGWECCFPMAQAG